MDWILGFGIPAVFLLGAGPLYPFVAREYKRYGLRDAEAFAVLVALSWPLTIWVFSGWVRHKREHEDAVHDLNRKQRQTLNFEKARVAVIEQASTAIERWKKVTKDVDVPTRLHQKQ